MADPPDSKNDFPLTAIYAFTPQGFRLGLRIGEHSGGELFCAASLQHSQRMADSPDLSVRAAASALQPHENSIRFFTSLSVCLNANFKRHRCHIIIGATGMAIRCLTPLLQSKQTDPAVLVLDQNGEFVISLLSGHLGQANHLARLLAKDLNAKAVITTGTDAANVAAIELLAQKTRLGLGTPQAVKHINGALIAGQSIALFDPLKKLYPAAPHHFRLMLASSGQAKLRTQELYPRTTSYDTLAEQAEQLEETSRAYDGPAVFVSPFRPSLQAQHLLLHPRILHLGIGCKKYTRKNTILKAVTDIFGEYRLSLQGINAIASITAKREESGLFQAATALAVPIRFFSSERLGLFPGPSFSAKCHELFQVHSVCESAALASAAPHGRLLLAKQKINGVTLAIALNESSG